MSIAPTGSISNIVLGYRSEEKNYIGVSGGVRRANFLYILYTKIRIIWK